MKRIFVLLIASLLMTMAGQATESAKLLSKKEVRNLIANANTPADHNKLANNYRLQAEKLDAEANEHAEMAKIYRERPSLAASKHPMGPDTAPHCEYWADSLRKAAVEARALSTAHADMAKK